MLRLSLSHSISSLLFVPFPSLPFPFQFLLSLVPWCTVTTDRTPHTVAHGLEGASCCVGMVWYGMNVTVTVVVCTCHNTICRVNGVGCGMVCTGMGGRAVWGSGGPCMHVWLYGCMYVPAKEENKTSGVDVDSDSNPNLNGGNAKKENNVQKRKCSQILILQLRNRTHHK